MTASPRFISPSMHKHDGRGGMGRYEHKNRYDVLGADGEDAESVGGNSSEEPLVDSDVEDQVTATAEVDILEHRVPRPILLLGFSTEGMLRRSVVIPASRQMASRASAVVSWAALRLPACFLAAATSRTTYRSYRSYRCVEYGPGEGSLTQW